MSVPSVTAAATAPARYPASSGVKVTLPTLALWISPGMITKSVSGKAAASV